MTDPTTDRDGGYKNEPKWRCGRCLLLREQCNCGWPFSYRDYGDGHPLAEETSP